jgi:hypothetical protein
MKAHVHNIPVLGILGAAAALTSIRDVAALDEVVVYGTPPAIAFDAKIARVDVADYLRVVNVSLRTSVAETLKKPSPDIEVASASPSARTRG